MTHYTQRTYNFTSETREVETVVIAYVPWPDFKKMSCIAEAGNQEPVMVREAEFTTIRTHSLSLLVSIIT